MVWFNGMVRADLALCRTFGAYLRTVLKLELAPTRTSLILGALTLDGFVRISIRLGCKVVKSSSLIHDDCVLEQT